MSKPHRVESERHLAGRVSHIVEVRLKRCGARWHEETGSHVVQLRALALSDRWDGGVALTLKNLRALVRLAS